MNHYGYTYKKGQKLVGIDNKDKTASLTGKAIVVYFFRSELASGHILAFYSHSPWGRCHDMEKGWVVIDPTNKCIIEECPTRTMGEATGEYRPWIKEIRESYGKTKKVFRDESGRYLWKMEE